MLEILGVVTSCRKETMIYTANSSGTSSSSSNSSSSSTSISPIISDLLQTMQIRLSGTPVRKLLVLFQSWSALFLLLDHSYATSSASSTSTATSTSSATTTSAASTSVASGLHVRGVPELWRQLEGLQKTHGDLVVLLQEVVRLLDRQGRAGAGAGGARGGGGEGVETETGVEAEVSPVVTADLTLAGMRQFHTALLVSVELLHAPVPALGSPSSSFSSSSSCTAQSTSPSRHTDTVLDTDTVTDIDTDTDTDTAAATTLVRAEVDLLDLTEHLLRELHSWTQQLVLALTAFPRAPALLGVLTLDFSPPEEENEGQQVRGEGEREGVTKCLTLNLRSE